MNIKTRPATAVISQKLAGNSGPSGAPAVFVRGIARWLVAATLAWSATSVPQARADLFGITEQEEIKAGEQVRQQAIKEYGQPLPASDPRQQRVARLGALFARQAERRNIPYSYTVLQNDKVLNAFAAPGGPIFVTTKLLSTAANDGELAFVLGHETGHIENKHIVKSVEKQQKVGLAAGILGAILGNKKGGNVIGAAVNVTATLWQRGYSRDQERDSDDYGVRAMAKLGFDPNAAVSMMGKLGSGGGGLEKYLATHPDPASRQERLRGVIAKENLIDVSQRNRGNRYSSTDTNSGSWSPVAFGNDGSGARGSRVTQAPATASDAGVELVMSERQGYRVVLASVVGLARWAGAGYSTQGGAVTLRRGDNQVVLQVNSGTARLNGRATTLSHPVVFQDQRLFSPLGALVSGLGGSAQLEPNGRSVRVSFPGGPSAVWDLPA